MLKPGDLIHYHNPNPTGFVINTWNERYAVIGHNAMLIVAEKTDGMGFFHRPFYRNIGSFEDLTPRYRVTKMVEQSFLWFKYNAWRPLDADDLSEMPHIAKAYELAEIEIQKTKSWFDTNFYRCFQQS